MGIVDVKPRQARAKLDTFLADHGLSPLEYQSALIPLYAPNARVTRRVGRTDVLFVGDAAGQVKVTTVGGTVTGVRGAHAAARAIARRTTYAWESRAVNRELRLHWYIRNLMNRFRDTEYDVLLISQDVSAACWKFTIERVRSAYSGLCWRSSRGSRCSRRTCCGACAEALSTRHSRLQPSPGSQPSMYILGINAYHAGASACLIRDGDMIAAAEEERFHASSTARLSLGGHPLLSRRSAHQRPRARPCRHLARPARQSRQKGRIRAVAASR